MENKNNIHVFSIHMNNYTKPSVQSLLTQARRWYTNGSNNSYYYDIEKLYYGSPTNASIIDAFQTYIYGEGIQYVNSSEDIHDILSEDDARLLSLDIKMNAAIAIQVVYSKDRKSIAKLFHIPVKTVAMDRGNDITEPITGYWVCFDWTIQSRFKPQYIPAYGCSEDSPTELFYARIPSMQPLFSPVDYESCTQYCTLEEELSNYFINHIKNNFSAGKIININQGVPADDDVREDTERRIKNKVAGTDNAGNVIVSFNDNKDNATTVENVEITDAYQQFQWLSEEASKKIMKGHKVNDPALFGDVNGSGFASVAEQMVTSLKILYRNRIKPLRAIITNALEEILSYNNKDVKIEFIDFEELRVKEEAPIDAPIEAPSIETEMAKFKLGLTFSYALTDEGIALIKKYNRIKDLYIISSRPETEFMLEFARENGIPIKNVYGMGDVGKKINKIKELDLDEYLDTNESVINQLPAKVGKLVNSK